MRMLIASVIVALGVASSATAGTYPCSTGNDQGTMAFHRYRSKNAEIIVHKGNAKGASLPQGFTALDGPTKISCDSANGCLLTVATMVLAPNALVCSSVDGKFIFPRQSFTSIIVNRLQSGTVSQGSHVIQTHLYEAQSGYGLNEWEVDYTLYDGG